jgi:hypothetical protein
MSKELVISANRHETKVAILEDDQLVEVFFQRANEYSLAGSIHKGRVTRVLPGMQSAFVDLGLERDTFLYVSDFFEENEEFDRVSVSREGPSQERTPRGPEVLEALEEPGRGSEPPRQTRPLQLSPLRQSPPHPPSGPKKVTEVIGAAGDPAGAAIAAEGSPIPNMLPRYRVVAGPPRRPHRLRNQSGRFARVSQAAVILPCFPANRSPNTPARTSSLSMMRKKKRSEASSNPMTKAAQRQFPSFDLRKRRSPRNPKRHPTYLLALAALLLSPRRTKTDLWRTPVLAPPPQQQRRARDSSRNLFPWRV